MRIVIPAIQSDGDHVAVRSAIKIQFPSARVDILDPESFMQSLRPVNARVQRSRWYQQVPPADIALLASISGRTSHYPHQLPENRFAPALQEFMEAGGKVMGLCAGAYYLAAQARFTRRESCPPVHCPSIGLFQGLAEGPVPNAPQGQWHTHQAGQRHKMTMRTVGVRLVGDQTEIQAQHFLGPHFTPAALQPEGVRIEALAHYVGSDRSAAILVHRNDTPAAVLSGIVPLHPLQGPILQRLVRPLLPARHL